MYETIRLSSSEVKFSWNTIMISTDKLWKNIRLIYLKTNLLLLVAYSTRKSVLEMKTSSICWDSHSSPTFRSTRSLSSGSSWTSSSISTAFISTTSLITQTTAVDNFWRSPKRLFSKWAKTTLIFWSINFTTTDCWLRLCSIEIYIISWSASWESWFSAPISNSTLIFSLDL